MYRYGIQIVATETVNPLDYEPETSDADGYTLRELQAFCRERGVRVKLLDERGEVCGRVDATGDYRLGT